MFACRLRLQKSVQDEQTKNAVRRIYSHQKQDSRYCKVRSQVILPRGMRSN